MAEKAMRAVPFQPDLFNMWDKASLVAACMELGAGEVSGWTRSELALTRNLPKVELNRVHELAEGISAGQDPIGDAFCQFRSAVDRRPLGATYTPLPIVRQMICGLRNKAIPDRIVDPGCGSARFLVAAGREFRKSELIGFEIDPFAGILAKGHLAAAGLSKRASVFLTDYRSAPLDPIRGQTLFIGNPPYVRHHLLSSKWKDWLVQNSNSLGHKASQLAGLHVYFFLATVLKAKRDDFGSFITAAEWLEVNYGSIVRQLFLDQLGGTGITIIEPSAEPFPDASTTAAVTSFTIGSKPKTIELARVESLDLLSKPKAIRRIKRERLENESRWSHLTRGAREIPSDFIELGELCRVHRGAVTGANRIWIAGEHSEGIPADFLFPTVTRARELQAAGMALVDASQLRKVIDLPQDLESVDPCVRKEVQRFLKYVKRQGADQGYVAQNRRAWWSVGLRNPAPILATYMARRPPSFVRNKASARHINIAHGLYPREDMSVKLMEALVKFLRVSVSTVDGRTYSGGLTKFEPREMERLLIPKPDVIENFV